MPIQIWSRVTFVWGCGTQNSAMFSYDNMSDNVNGDGHSSSQRSWITISKLVNVFLIVLFAIAIILHIVCLSVMAAKHNELVDKFSGDQGLYNVEKSCILFVNYDANGNEIHWVNNKCHLVIYGSAVLAGCALLMIIFIAMRTLLFRKLVISCIHVVTMSCSYLSGCHLSRLRL